MAGARLWPHGYVSGFCNVGGDHDRCRMPHVADPDIAGCHCPVCLAVAAIPEPELVDVEPDPPNPAEAPPAPEPGASAGTNDASPPVVVQGDAAHLPLPDASVDLIVTSPPYFALRSYQDGGKHYAGQVGAEPTPAEFVDSLIACTREWCRVLKPTGSIWVNLGDKYSQRVALRRSSHQDGLFPGRPELAKDWKRDREAGLARMPYENVVDSETGRHVPEKSLMGLPWRYALRCIDELGLILRAEVIWAKPNGLPESVVDRVRRSHETWFHFTMRPRYFSAIDEIREPYQPTTVARYRTPYGERPYEAAQQSKGYSTAGETLSTNPRGKLPGSVWTVATEPLKVPAELGVDHFAAFPTAWPWRIIQGWTPAGYCTACGEPRRPKVATVALDMGRPHARRAQELADNAGLTEEHFAALLSVGVSDTGRGAATQSGTGKNTAEVYALAAEARQALGGYSREYLLRRPTSFAYACDCPTADAPTRPAVVLDPFGGTGTTALCADLLGRVGVTVDLSHDYSRLARWRTTDEQHRAKVAAKRRRVATRPAGPVAQPQPQLDLDEDDAA